MEQEKVNRRDALKRLAKMTVVATVAVVLPEHLRAKETGSLSLGYYSFAYLNYGKF